MMGLADALPQDVEALQALILSERAAHAAEAGRLRQIIKEMRRHRFGGRAETLPIDQLELSLEDVQQMEADEHAKAETQDPERRAASAARRRSNRDALPKHLPRIETLVDIADKTCPCCAGALHVIGEDRAERLDIVPARLRVLVVRRPKYACRTCEDLVVQAPAPARLIEGNLPTEATVAHVVVGKYADHLPLYRQAQSRPLIQALEPWLRAKLETLSQKTKLAEAIGYPLSRWAGLTRFLDDGRIEIDNNVVERSIRPLALTRKNSLFAGSDGGAEHGAILASLIETAKLNEVDPQAYITDVITRIVQGHPQSQIDQLMPWNHDRESATLAA